MYQKLHELFSDTLSDYCRELENRKPTNLYIPISYALSSGGKHLRPLMLMAAAKGFGREPESIINQALAIEMFHNFTLVHDDVMDHSDTRRGRPTVHAKYGSVSAILCGDTMLTLASQLMAEGLSAENNAMILDRFNRMAIDVYEGQQLDMEFESRAAITVDEYIGMVKLKTSALLQAACEIGGMLSEARKSDVEDLSKYAYNYGIAFQLRDDWLDVYGKEDFGKPIGLDIINRKKTWMLVTAMNRRPEELRDIFNEDIDPAETVKQVKRLYDRLDISGLCTVEIGRHVTAAIDALSGSGIAEESKDFFADLARKCIVRTI